MEKFSPDPNLLPEDLILKQPDKGYRFSMDSLVLASQVNPAGIRTVIDAGCGCGVISLILAKKFPDLQITGIEIQPELFAFARQNTLLNHLDKQVSLICRDINHVTAEDLNSLSDLLISNPPYKKKDTGRLNPDPVKAVARHELYLNLDQLFQAADRLLSKNGRLMVILPADRCDDLEAAMQKNNFHPVSLQFILTHPSQPARRVILSAAKQPAASFTVLPALTIQSN